MIRPAISIKGKVHLATVHEYPELEDVEITPTLEDQKIKSDMYGINEVLVKGVQAYIDEDIKPEYIKEGVDILGVVGNYKGIDTSDATATSEDIASGATAYVNGEKITGNVEIKTSGEFYKKATKWTANSGKTEFFASLDYPYLIKGPMTFRTYIESSKLANTINLTSDKIVEGNTILGIEGSAKLGTDTSDATATAEDILKDKTAYVNGERIVGNLEVKDMSEFNTSMINEGIAGGYWDTKLNNYVNNIHKAIKKIDMPIILNTKSLDTSTSPSRLYAIFAHCSNLEEIKELNFSNLAYAACYIFVNCSSLKKSPNILNSRYITNISGFFSGCTSLVDLSYFDISSVNTMSGMFYDCIKLSDDSLNTILLMCSNAVKVTKNKTLKFIGLTQDQATRCQTLSNYQAFLDAGWTTGY